jgi:ferritin-like metal-binding protein YciE
MAEKLGEGKAVNLLSQTLQEEKDTDVKQSKLADKMTVEEDSTNEAKESLKTRPSKGKAAKA